MTTENNNQPTAQIAQAESLVMSRSDAAAARRNIADTAKTLMAIRNHLVSAPVTELNANDVAQKLLAAAQMQTTLKNTEQLLLGALPSNTGAKLSQKERTEIKGYYATGRYTQDALASQYEVSQATIHNVISE